MAQMNNANTKMEMDWDDEIQIDDMKFVVLEEGDYNFEVSKVERGNFPGSAKISPSKKVTLTLLVVTDSGLATCRTDLILNRVVEFRLAQFFYCIGQKKKGEPFKMEWDKVLGAKGRAHFKPRTYTAADGSLRCTNDVITFYEYDPAYFGKDSNMVSKKTDWAAIPNSADDEGMPFD